MKKIVFLLPFLLWCLLPVSADSTVTADEDLPIYGNFQMGSNDETHAIKLLFFSPEGEMSIFNMIWDENLGYTHNQELYNGTYHVEQRVSDTARIVSFRLTTPDNSVIKTGTLRIDFIEGDDTRLHELEITPMGGFNLGLPDNQATRLTISAFQAWD